MLLGDADLAAFKHWLLPRLETFSDADKDVLADYVIALVTVKDSEPNIRRSCHDHLTEFLHDNTGTFVEEVLAVLRKKSYRTHAPAKTHANGATAYPTTIGSTAIPVARDKRAKYARYTKPPALRPPFGAPRGPAAMRASGATGAAMRAPDTLLKQHGDATASRKRKASDHETNEPHGPVTTSGKRVKEEARSNLRGSAPPFQPAFAPNAHNAVFSSLSNLSSFPSEPLTPADFIQKMAAHGAAMRPPLIPLTSKDNCPDYYTKGFCAMGTLCRYVHDDDAYLIPATRILEYDPQQPGLSMQQQQQQQTMSRPTVNGGLDIDGTYANSASRRTLVVERIPEQYRGEDSVRGYFSQYGPITEVKLYDHLVIVTFEDHTSAQEAVDSPKSVFDDRFVNVSWYRPTEVTRETSSRSYGDVHTLVAQGYDAWPPLDLEAIAKRQAEKQVLFEERQRKKKEADAKAAEIEKKLLETNLEIIAVRRQIAELTWDASSDSEDQTGDQLANLNITLGSLFKAEEKDDDVQVKIEEVDEQISSEPDLDVAEDRDQWM